MQPELARYGLSVVALSNDTIEKAAAHKKRDNLSLTLLSDEKLEVIRQYGVEHHKALGFSNGIINFFGIPIGLLPSFQAMAIPTTLLVDAAGIVRWIDQAADYRIRSDNERVLSAVKEIFG